MRKPTTLIELNVVVNRRVPVGTDELYCISEDCASYHYHLGNVTLVDIGAGPWHPNSEPIVVVVSLVFWKSPSSRGLISADWSLLGTFGMRTYISVYACV